VAGVKRHKTWHLTRCHRNLFLPLFLWNRTLARFE
jgi:hypothetical protein